MSAPIPDLSCVGAGLFYESAHLHVTGRATYIDDLPVPAGTLHAALGLSAVAHGASATWTRRRCWLPLARAVITAPTSRCQ